MRVLLLVLLVVSLCAGGCRTTWTEVSPPWTAATVAGELRVQATLAGGATIVLENPTLTREDGFLLLYGETPAGRFCVPLESVRVLYVERDDLGHLGASMFAELVMQGIGGLAGSALRF